MTVKSNWDKVTERVRPVVEENSRAIAEIAAQGAVAVLVINPMGETKEAARGFGWDGKTPVFKLGSGVARRLAKVDHVTKRWVERREGVRVFVLIDRGTLLLNCDDVRGWHLEPNSLDSHVLS